MTDERRHSRLLLAAAGLAVLVSTAFAGLVTQSGPKLFTASSSSSSSSSGGALACEFYIDDAGSDSNNGLTTGTPWAITALNTKHATYASTVVCLMDGTYDLSGMSAVAGSTRISIAPGVDGDPTVVQSVNARAAILDGGASSEDAAIGSVEADAGYITLKEITVQNCRKHSVIFQHTPNSAANQGLGLIVEGLEVKDQHQTSGSDFAPAVLIQGFDEPIFRNNYVHDITHDVNPDSSPACMDMYANRGAIIEFNTFESCNFGYYDKYGSGGVEMQGTIVRFNYFLNLNVALIGFDNKPQTFDPPDEGPYDPYVINNNVFETVSVALGDTGSFSADAPVYWYNNTLYRASGTTSGPSLHTRSAGREPSAYNNIIYNGGSWHEWRAVTVSLDGGAAAVDVLDYNMYGPSSSSWQYYDILGYPYAAGGNYGTESTIAAWRTTTGAEAASVVDDPEFTMTGTGAARFQLGGSSPALNAGRVGGVSGGATRHMGAWDGVVTQIGHDW